jgi:predicted dehydrogenase
MEGRSAQLAVKKVRYGMIGSGAAARALHLPRLRRDARVEVVWCADVRAETAAQTAARFGVPHTGTSFERLLDEHPVDAVSICIPHNEHHAAVMAALCRGVHVCCEKPLGMSYTEAAALAAAADKAGVCGMVNYVYRFMGTARLLKTLIDAGELGKIVQVHGCYAQALAVNETPLSWRFQKAAAGSGALADLASHLVHLTQWWAGDLRRVFAHCATLVPERSDPATGRPAAVDVDDVCALLGEFSAGAVFQLTASRMMKGHKNDQRIEVSGMQGAAIYENKARALRVCIGDAFAKSAAWKLAPPPQRLVAGAMRRAGRASWVRLTPPADCRADAMTHFIDAITEGRPLESDFHDAVRVFAVLAAAERSAATGAWVEVASPVPAGA